MSNQERTKQPYFSIIMPTYGVERYIAAALKSIQAQTFPDWELIVVNDCTRDRSAEIAGEFARQDARIRVVHHKENRGLSAARNTGTKEAQGRYIWYMDPDDFVEEDLLEEARRSLEKNPAQILVFGLHEEYYGKDGTFGYRHTICPEEHFFKSAEELRPYIIKLEQETLYGYAWNKMYELAYLKKLGLKYENVKLIEDIVFNIKFCMDITAMNTLAITPYHYAKRVEGNLTNKYVPDYFKLHRQRISLLTEQQKYWNCCTPEVAGVLGSLYARYILSAMERNCDKRSGMDHGDRRRWCRALFSDPLFGELIPQARARDSRALSVWLTLLRGKRPALCLAMGRTVYCAHSKLPMLYSKIKSGR